MEILNGIKKIIPAAEKLEKSVKDANDFALSTLTKEEGLTFKLGVLHSKVEMLASLMKEISAEVQHFEKTCADLGIKVGDHV